MADFVGGDAKNDCLDVVLAHYPAVAEALQWLDHRSSGGARLTGTGGCVYATFGDRGAAEAVAAVAPGRYAAFVARGCNRSPLFESADAP
jgi:4-diphosphocytidyl-2-C-methyl-D-erythritol kinase